MNTKEIVAKSHSAIDTVIKNEKDLIERGLAEYWEKWLVANNTILCFLVLFVEGNSIENEYGLNPKQ